MTIPNVFFTDFQNSTYKGKRKVLAEELRFIVFGLRYEFWENRKIRYLFVLYILKSKHVWDHKYKVLDRDFITDVSYLYR